MSPAKRANGICKKTWQLFRTLKYLRPKQILYKIWYKIHRPSYTCYIAPDVPKRQFRYGFICKPTSLTDEGFVFLNIPSVFKGWNDVSKGYLWTYNLNYMDYLLQPDLKASDGAYWIDEFIENIHNNKIGLNSYPIALRCINWVKFFSIHPQEAHPNRMVHLYSQYKYLSGRLEYDLLGNHLLEDFFSLYIVASYFNDHGQIERIEKKLLLELEEEILPDGAHYEQSPMYHTILLDRLLDCINIRPTDSLRKYAIKMLGHLESILWDDGTYPMFNDSAEGIGPPPNQIFKYAKELGLNWHILPMKECGYRKMSSLVMSAFVDVGNITASYQPGHSHADTFNYELRVGGKPFVVDTGITTYNKNERRQYERSTSAHNTVVVDGGNSSEMWSGFRVGKRANVEIIVDTPYVIKAKHDGFEKYVARCFQMRGDSFDVLDSVEGEGVSYIHLAPGVVIVGQEDNQIKTNIATIRIDGATVVNIVEGAVSKEYNKAALSSIVEISFSNELLYSITNSRGDYGYNGKRPKVF